MTEETKPLNLHQRLHAIMAEAKPVTPDGHTAGAAGGYRYRSIGAVLAAVRPLFIKHRVICTQSLKEHTQDGNRVEAVYEITFRSIDEHGDDITVESLGHGIDKQDKGPGKSSTYALKDALCALFMLASDLDNEAHDIDHEPTPAPAPQADAPNAAPTRGQMAGDMMRWVDEMGLDSADLTDMCQHTEKTGFSQMDEESQARTYNLVRAMHKRYCDLVPKGQSPDLRALATGETLNGYPMRAGLAEWGAMINTALKGD